MKQYLLLVIACLFIGHTYAQSNLNPTSKIKEIEESAPSPKTVPPPPLLDIPAPPPQEPKCFCSWVEELPYLKAAQNKRQSDSLIRQHIIKSTNLLKNEHGQFDFEEEGAVYVRCIVFTDGTLGEIEVVKSFCPSNNEIAVAMVNELAQKEWIPGKSRNKLIDMRLVIPIKFKKK